MSTDFRPFLAWLDDQYEDMLAKTIALAETNSGSLNTEGVNRCAQC